MGQSVISSSTIGMSYPECFILFPRFKSRDSIIILDESILLTKSLKILVLGGDGIGPEVVDAALELLVYICDHEGLSLDMSEDLLHGKAYDKYGTFCRDETVELAKQADALIVGSVGGPKWDNLNIVGSPESKDGLMRLRKELNTFAGLRPSKCYDALIDHTPFKSDVVKNTDIMVIRELCGGLFFGYPRGIDELSDGSFQGYDSNYYTSPEIERFARIGFELAGQRRGKVVSMDKSNVTESGVLWRRVVSQIGEKEYPDIELVHQYADNALYQMTRHPTAFDVIIADNLFGDLTSDLAGTMAGSLGMLPSACLSTLRPDQDSLPGIYEPVHGSAPDIEGQNIANPIGMILSVAMMLQYTFNCSDIADEIEQAVVRTISAGINYT